MKIHRTELDQVTVDGYLVVITEIFKEEHETWDEFLLTVREMLDGREWSLAQGGARMVERNKVPLTEPTKKKARR